MAASVLGGEVSFFEVVVDCVLVFFRDMEYEGTEACIVVSAVFSLNGCAADSDNYTCGCFSNFDN